MKDIDVAEQLKILSANTAIIVPEKGLEAKLKNAKAQNKPLRVKLGFDPTAPDLHLGHAVVLRKLKEFQDLGHQIVIIIGDFTALIGDPSGKNKTRPQLTEAEVLENTKTYVDQVEKILDKSKLEIRHNAEWFSKMNMHDAVELLAQSSLAQMLERDDFENRYKTGSSISLHELMYPLLQGYDSTQIDSDIEMGGTDQLFNCLVGRHLQEKNDDPAQIVISMPLLRGLDGVNKMGKSLGNYIALYDEPNDMFGKVMSLPDDLLYEYLDLASNFSQDEIVELKAGFESEKLHPLELKKMLAFNITAFYHDEAAAEEAQKYFETQFQRQGEKQYAPFKLTDAESLSGMNIVDLCVMVEPNRSKSMIRRLLTEGGVSIDEQKITDPDYVIAESVTSIDLRIGKKGFYKVR